jgi:hypothetical protein
VFKARLVNVHPKPVMGRWNGTRCTWTTTDGRFKIVRRFSVLGAPGAWLVYVLPGSSPTEFTRFSLARQHVTRLAGGPIPTSSETLGAG